MFFKKLNFSFSIFILIGLIACEETKPIIPCLSCEQDTIDTTFITKKVLLEEFTGVRCVNCPKAKQEIENLQSASNFGDKLIAVSYHAGFFSRPYPQSQNDFQTTAGDMLIEFLGQPIGFPAGVINRKLFSGEDDLQLEQFAAWGGFVAPELEEEAQVAIDLETTYNQSNRVLNISTSITPTQNINEDLNLSILITENDISSVQLTPDGIINDYAQTHVFRAMISNTFGNPIEELLIANQAISSIFSYTLPPEWNAENCNIIAFVHQTGVSKEVLQVEETKVIQ